MYYSIQNCNVCFAKIELRRLCLVHFNGVCALFSDLRPWHTVNNLDVVNKNRHMQNLFHFSMNQNVVIKDYDNGTVLNLRCDFVS